MCIYIYIYVNVYVYVNVNVYVYVYVHGYVCVYVHIVDHFFSGDVSDTHADVRCFPAQESFNETFVTPTKIRPVLWPRFVLAVLEI